MDERLSMHPAVIIFRSAMLLLPIAGWGCGHGLPDALTELRQHHKEVSGVVIVQGSPAGLGFDDPECNPPGHLLFFMLQCMFDARERGGRLTREFDIEDPTLRVVERFIGELSTQLDTRNLRVLPTLVENADQAEFGAALAVTFESFEQRFTLIGKVPENLNYSPMIFWYGVRSAVTQVNTKKTLWAEACYYRTDERGEGPYSYGELLADKGTKMKQILAHAAEVCGRELAAKLLATGR